MKKKMHIDNITFWADRDVIYCRFEEGNYKKNILRSIDDIFYSAITSLSNGKYMPLLIDLRAVNTFNIIKIFKHVVESSLIKSISLSIAYVTNYTLLTISLYIYNLTIIHVIPVGIFNNMNQAIKHCHKHYNVFNPINQKIY